MKAGTVLAVLLAACRGPLGGEDPVFSQAAAVVAPWTELKLPPGGRVDFSTADALIVRHSEADVRALREHYVDMLRAWGATPEADRSGGAMVSEHWRHKGLRVSLSIVDAGAERVVHLGLDDVAAPEPAPETP